MIEPMPATMARAADVLSVLSPQSKTWVASRLQSVFSIVAIGMLLLASSAKAQLLPPLALPDVRLSSDGEVRAIARLSDGSVVVGGTFGWINGVARSNIAKLNPDGVLDLLWNPSANGTVHALAIGPGDAIYAAGDFTYMGDLSRSRIAKLSSASAGEVDAAWNPISDYSVYALAVDSSGAIYAGGTFSNIGGRNRAGLARLAGTGSGAADFLWAPSVGGYVLTIALDPAGMVYVGGGFQTVSGQSRRSIAKLNSSSFGALDPTWNPSSDGIVNTMAVDNAGRLYVGGHFGAIGGAARTGLARLSGAGFGLADPTWNPAPNDAVFALALGADNALVVAGAFTHIGQQEHSFLAKINVSGAGDADPAWAAAADDTVLAISVAADGVVRAGGVFQSINGQTRRGFAEIAADGLMLATPADVERAAAIRAVVRQPDGGTIIAGHFKRADGIPRSNIVRLAADATVDQQWNAAADGGVSSLALGADGAIYAGGYFTRIGGVDRSHLAKLVGDQGVADPAWNPTADDNVYALAVVDDAVYVGGAFTTIDSIGRARIAKLSASGDVDPNWNPSANNIVSVIAADAQGGVYVGGAFTNIGGASRNRIAKLAALGNGEADAAWNPSANSHVFALALDQSASIYAGGYFSNIGGRSRSHVAKLSRNGTGAADSTWNAAANDVVFALAVDGGNAVYAGGYFTTMGIATHRHVARLSTANGAPDPDWKPALGLGGEVNAIAIDEATGAIYAGGQFSVLGSSSKASFAAFAPRLPTTIIATTTPVSTVVGEAYSTNFTVTAGSRTPTGSVVVADENYDLCGPVVLVSGAGSCALVSASAGTSILTATFTPDSDYFAASGTTIAHFVVPASTSLVIEDDNNPSIPGQSIEIGALLTVVAPGAGTPTGSITISDGADSCVIPQVGTNCVLTLTARGPHTLTATYAGDSDFNASSAEVTHSVNRLPVLSSESYAVVEDTSLTVAAAQGVLANASDPDGDALTLANAGTIAASGIGGSVVLNADGSFDYTPPADANGTATFEYTVSDGLEEVTATATITVEAVNDAPAIALASVPAWPAGEAGAKMQPGFASVSAFGPPDEAGQQVQAWTVRTIADPASIASNVAISTDGTLSYTLSGNAGSATFGVKLQDDGGVANGGNDTSAEQSFTITVAAGLDLSIAIDDDRNFVPGGGAVEYTIVVHNAGPNAAVGAQVKNLLPFNLVDASWTCAPDAGASCTPTGAGDIDDTVTLPMGATLTYLLGATVVADPEAPVENSASVLSPAGVPDANSTNNAATDTNAVGIFADGFGEAGATLH